MYLQGKIHNTKEHIKTIYIKRTLYIIDYKKKIKLYIKGENS